MATPCSHRLPQLWEAVIKVEGWAGMARLSAPLSAFLAPSHIPDPDRSQEPHTGSMYAANLLISTARKPYTKSLTSKHLFNNSMLTLSTHERRKKQTLRFIFSNKCAHLTPSQYNSNNKKSLFSVISCCGGHEKSFWINPHKPESL